MAPSFLVKTSPLGEISKPSLPSELRQKELTPSDWVFNSMN